MKIAVYAISKNEEQFVKTFCESSKLADYIMIADTGSTDGTVEEVLQYVITRPGNLAQIAATIDA